MKSLDTIATWIDDYAEFVRPLIKNTWASVCDYYLCANRLRPDAIKQDGIVQSDAIWRDDSCPWPEPFIRELFTLWSRSDYAAESCARYPQWLSSWSGTDTVLTQVLSEQQCQQSLYSKCELASDEAELMVVLRQFRRAQMLRILWRDLLGKVELEQTLEDVTALADVCVRVALDWLHQSATARYGVPMSKHGEIQQMIVLGMGKLGARELNVSSDIDLIFAYPQSGMTDHPRKPVENHLFFTRLAQRLIHVLDQMTGEGFVFRVDMRLRPYGGSGALALNFAAFEDYYQNQGREWERFAMIKARAITGDSGQGRALLEIINPFVYKKYTDFTSFQALRDMKSLIMSEVHRKGGNQNIKLGQGGIREIEFIAQACQLIYGGRNQSLQIPGLMPVFVLLKQALCLPEHWVDQLLESYRFLRRMEHAIQGLADKQTQLIPEAEEERSRVAWSLGFSQWSEAELLMQQHRSNVSQIFDDFLNDSDEQENEAVDGNEHWLHLWQARASSGQWLQALKDAGYETPAESYELLMALKQSRLFGVMSSDAKQRLEQFLPLLLSMVSEYPHPSLTLERVLSLVRAILGRTVYLVLLYENPGALRQLCHLCSESPWISEHLAKSPVILDELIDIRSLYQPPDKATLQDELRQYLLRIPEDDLEAQMDCLRTFRQSHMLRVAAAEIGGQLPLMKVSDYLTWLAETLLEQSVNIAWHNMVAKYGQPAGLLECEPGAGFAVVGYGKLGGIELGYSSDLDMVFLYDTNDNAMTTGERSINNQVFYTRLGQRVIHILSTQTTQGVLYESDMRLRPSGNSGMLVTSLAAYRKYQQQDAWTWEHQALVRARFITGDSELGSHFEQVRRDVLTRDRDQKDLHAEVVAMRDKMRLAARDKFNSEVEAKDDIKQGEGGLIDIEFITQYGVLRGAGEHQGLLEWTDNIRLLETLAKLNCFDGVDVSPLIEAYRQLRSALHRKSLADDDYTVSLADFPDIRKTVAQVWQHVLVG